MSTKKEALAALGDTKSNESFDGFTGSSQYQDFLNRLYQVDGTKVNQKFIFLTSATNLTFKLAE